MLLVPWSSQDSDWMTPLFSVAVDNSFCCECMVFFLFHHISTVLLGSVWVTTKAVQTFIRGVAPVVARPDQDRVHKSQNTRQRVHALSSIITSFLPKSDPYQNWRGSFNFFYEIMHGFWYKKEKKKYRSGIVRWPISLSTNNYFHWKRYALHCHFCSHCYKKIYMRSSNTAAVSGLAVMELKHV